MILFLCSAILSVCAGCVWFFLSLLKWIYAAWPISFRSTKREIDLLVQTITKYYFFRFFNALTRFWFALASRTRARAKNKNKRKLGKITKKALHTESKKKCTKRRKQNGIKNQQHTINGATEPTIWRVYKKRMCVCIARYSHANVVHFIDSTFFFFAVFFILIDFHPKTKLKKTFLVSISESCFQSI